MLFLGLFSTLLKKNWTDTYKYTHIHTYRKYAALEKVILQSRKKISKFQNSQVLMYMLEFTVEIDALIIVGCVSFSKIRNSI